MKYIDKEIAPFSSETLVCYWYSGRYEKEGRMQVKSIWTKFFFDKSRFFDFLPPTHKLNYDVSQKNFFMKRAESSDNKLCCYGKPTKGN